MHQLTLMLPLYILTSLRKFIRTYKLILIKKQIFAGHEAALIMFSWLLDGEDPQTYDQPENTVNPLRCPVKLYEFYISKW